MKGETSSVFLVGICPLGNLELLLPVPVLSRNVSINSLKRIFPKSQFWLSFSWWRLQHPLIPVSLPTALGEADRKKLIYSMKTFLLFSTSCCLFGPATGSSERGLKEWMAQKGHRHGKEQFWNFPSESAQLFSKKSHFHCFFYFPPLASQALILLPFGMRNLCPVTANPKSNHGWPQEIPLCSSHGDTAESRGWQGVTNGDKELLQPGRGRGMTQTPQFLWISLGNPIKQSLL